MENSKKQGKKKILDEDLAVSRGGCGGGCSSKEPDPHNDKRYTTEMKCSKCGCTKKWRGHFVDGITYPCPMCGNLSFRGESAVIKKR